VCTVAYVFSNVLVTYAIIKENLSRFQVNLKLLGWFFVCVLLESFIKFLVNPYYELLPWFMIKVGASCRGGIDKV